MENIIQEFLKKVTENNGDLSLNILSENIKKGTHEFGLNILKYLIEKLDEDIRNSKERKRNWYIERYDERIIYTSLGKLTFTRGLANISDKILHKESISSIQGLRSKPLKTILSWE